jgi:hypothetical protein
LLKERGSEYPLINQLISILTPDGMRPPDKLGINFDREQPIFTFDELFAHTPFLKQVRAILNTLRETLGYPIDIEFAHDGSDFYLLQCRAQSRVKTALL